MNPDPNLLTILQTVSPWVAALMIVAYIFDRVLKYLSSRDEVTTLGKLSSAIAVVGTKVDTVTSSQSRFRDALTNIEHERNRVVGEQRQLFDRMAIATERMVKELISLKALQGTATMASEEAKLLIEYQWAWCREEITRIITSSIDNNHFRGSEERVTRIVQRAWASASASAQESISRFTSLKYPYSPLFEVILPMLLERIWKQAVPIYHADRSNRAYAPQLEDLRDQGKELFETALSEYFRSVEDVESGPLYNSCAPAAVNEDVTSYRSELLSSYKEGSRSPASGEFDMRSEIRKRADEIASHTPAMQVPVVRFPPKPQG